MVADPVSLVAQYEEKAHVLLLSKLFAAYNVLAMFLLVPFLGIYGAAIAAGTAQTMKNLLSGGTCASARFGPTPALLCCGAWGYGEWSLACATD